MNSAIYSPVTGAPQPGVTFFLSPTPLKKERATYRRTLYWLGFIEIILGVTACALGGVGAAIISLQFREQVFTTFSGIWCGVFLIITGVVGCRLRKKSSVALVNANMTLSILTAVFMGIMLVMAVIGAVSRYGMSAVVEILLCLISVAGMVICVVHAVFCCATVCCIRRRPSANVIYTPIQPMQQFVQLANGQYMLVQGQTFSPLSCPGPNMETVPSQTAVDDATVPKPQMGTVPPPPYSLQDGDENQPQPAENVTLLTS